MGDGIGNFPDTAKSLTRNPFRIIALFLVLVYGLASLVTFAGSLTATERLPLIYFLIVFPVLVLSVFAWLVSRHSGRLFAPSDFKNEENYVRMQMAVVASLSAATVKGEPASEKQLQKIVETGRAVSPEIASAVTSVYGVQGQILWVDEIPQDNNYERKAFESIGVRFTLATSTREALELLGLRRTPQELKPQGRYFAIISAMGRRESPGDRYVLLDLLRNQGDQIPFFSTPHRRRPNIGVKPTSMELKAVRTTPQNFSRW